MAISQQRIQDAYAAIAFADDVRQLYGQLTTMQAKIARYGTDAAAVDGGTADDRQAKFVGVVRAAVDADDLTRIGALVPTIAGLVALLESDYGDFIHPA